MIPRRDEVIHLIRLPTRTERSEAIINLQVVCVAEGCLPQFVISPISRSVYVFLPRLGIKATKTTHETGT